MYMFVYMFVLYMYMYMCMCMCMCMYMYMATGDWARPMSKFTGVPRRRRRNLPAWAPKFTGVPTPVILCLWRFTGVGRRRISEQGRISPASGNHRRGRRRFPGRGAIRRRPTPVNSGVFPGARAKFTGVPRR